MVAACPGQSDCQAQIILTENIFPLFIICLLYTSIKKS